MVSGDPALLAGLAASAFLAATLLPGGSEAVFAALLALLGRHLKPRHKAEAMEILERMKREDD